MDSPKLQGSTQSHNFRLRTVLPFANPGCGHLRRNVTDQYMLSKKKTNESTRPFPKLATPILSFHLSVRSNHTALKSHYIGRPARITTLRLSTPLLASLFPPSLTIPSFLQTQTSISILPAIHLRVRDPPSPYSLCIASLQRGGDQSMGRMFGQAMMFN